jgi:hypothetical protein
MVYQIVPKMLKDKEVQILALDDKSVVYTMGNHGLSDRDFKYMGFTEVYDITERTEPIMGTYYSIGREKYVVIRKDGVQTIKPVSEGFEIELRNNCIVIIQVADSGVMYIKYG